MLQKLGLSSVTELYPLPEAAKLKGELKLAEGQSEPEVLAYLKSLAQANKIYNTSFRGGGFYRHYIPAAVKALTSLPGFVTAYTPYQAEISQGILRSIFEYQSSICALTGMAVSNASVYDGACAAAEAMVMCCTKKKKFVTVDNCDSFTLDVMQTYANARDIELVILESNAGYCDLDSLKNNLNEAAGFYLEYPNCFGLLEDYEAIGKMVHEAGSKYVMGCDPFALSILKTPAEYGADIAVGEGQGLGLDLNFGGPYFGFMACVDSLKRSLPGRIVGKTVDSKGQESYVLTLQAREQHIRREKASSSICSNQALCALQATIYLNAMGKEGYYEAGERACDLAHHLYDLLLEKGCKAVYEGEFFNEFVLDLPIGCEEFNAALAKKGILGGLALDEKRMMFVLTESNNLKEIDTLVATLEESHA